jgi:hypothetical protein
VSPRTLEVQNQIRSTTSGVEYDDTLDLSFAETIVNEAFLSDPTQVSGTLVMDLNFIRTAIRDIKGDTPTFNWFDPAATTGGLITLSGARGAITNLQNFVGSSGDLDLNPIYSSTCIVTQSGSLEQAIGELDSVLCVVSGVAASGLEVVDHTFIADSAIAQYDYVYITSDDDEVAPAKADSVSTIEVIGMALEAQPTPGGDVPVRLFGIVEGANTAPGITTGSPIFLDASTAGDFTSTPPSTIGHYILQVGHAINVDDILVHVNTATAIKNTQDTIPVQTLNTLSGTVTITGAGQVVVSTDTGTNVITVSGIDQTAVSGSLQEQIQKDRQVLIRTGGQVPADTTINLASLGAGWTSVGDTVSWGTVDHFIDQTMFFHNGQLLMTASGSGDDNDVYWVANPGSFACEFIVGTNDIIQVWRVGSTATLT